MNIEKEDFRQWLQSVHGDTFVGIPGSGTNCPIAKIKAITAQKALELL